MCLLFIGVATPLLVRGTNASPCQWQWKGIYSNLCSSPLLCSLLPIWEWADWFCVQRRTKHLIIKRDQNQNTSTKGLALGHQDDPYLSLWFQGGKHQKFLCYNKYIELQTSFDEFIPFGFLFFQEIFKDALDAFRSFHFLLRKKFQCVLLKFFITHITLQFLFSNWKGLIKSAGSNWIVFKTQCDWSRLFFPNLYFFNPWARLAFCFFF